MTTPPTPLGKDLLDSLSPEQRAELDARVAAAYAEAEVAALGGDLGSPPPPTFNVRDQVEREPIAGDRPRAHGVTAEEAERLRDAAEAAEAEDFTRFWDSRKAKPRKVLRNVLGVDLVLPEALPLAFEIESRRLQDSSDPRDIARLFDLLFGGGRYDELVARGLDADMFGVILMWGTLNGNGIDFTLAEAYAKSEELKARQGKALVERMTGSGPTSSATGDASRPTSPASTSSTSAPSPR